MVKQLSMVKLFIVIAIVIATVAGLIIFIRKPPEPHGGISLPTLQDSTSSPVDPGIDPPPISQPPLPLATVSVSINAIPWARVFIKLPENDHFMGPRARDFTIPPESNGRNSNVTPIPGDLKVPIGTTIKLLHRGKEKIFPYEAWKDGKTISHDFLNQ